MPARRANSPNFVITLAVKRSGLRQEFLDLERHSCATPGFFVSAPLNPIILETRR
jgi:hypothetical protein